MQACVIREGMILAGKIGKLRLQPVTLASGEVQHLLMYLQGKLGS